MGYLIFNTDREDEMKSLRSQMRRNMRSGNYRSYGGGEYREEYEQGYRQGYRHGAEDMEEENYRRRRDSMGRFE